jgi:hypothetical protein
MRGILDGIGLVAVFDDAIGRGLSIRFLHQKAIGSQLEHVGAIRAWRARGRFDLHRDFGLAIVN